MRYATMAVAAVMLAMSSLPAAAQWFHEQGEDDPFAGGAEHLAMTASRVGEIVGFRCTTDRNLAFLFVSIEKPQTEHLAAMSLLTARLLVIVDDAPKVEFVAFIDATPDGDRYRFTALSRELADLAAKAAAAKRRLAVAVEIEGKRLYSAAVGVRGSRAAISKLQAGCGIGRSAAAGEDGDDE